VGPGSPKPHIHTNGNDIIALTTLITLLHLMNMSYTSLPTALIQRIRRKAKKTPLSTGTPTGGMPSLVVMDILRKLIIAFTIWYPSRIFIGDNDKHQLTMLRKYNYGGCKAQGLDIGYAVSILVGHILLTLEFLT
jgi:hypothetical protein